MPRHRPTRLLHVVFLLFGLFLFVALAAAAEEGRAKEVSDDGLETVFLDEVVEPSPSEISEGTMAIFNATPDWENDFRIQVGGLQAADMNNDGRNDVVVGCYTSSSFPPYPVWRNYIYYNTGHELEAMPSWTSADEVSTGDIQVGDIDGDDFLDILAANGGFAMSPSVIYFGSASGPSTTPGWTEAGGSTWTNYARLFDLDHDEDLDLVTANQGNNPNDPYRPMKLFLNDEGSLDTTSSWQSAETSIQNFLAFGDLDGDTWEDLAVSKWINFESGVYKNLGATGGTLATTPMWTTGDDGDDKGVDWADIDDNGWMDLALGHDPTQVWTNDMGTLTATFSADGTFFGHSELRWYDVDRDGDPDLTEVHFSNGVVNLYRNDGGTLGTTPAWTHNAAGAGTALAYGDIDGDRWPDLIVGNSGDVSVMVFYNQLGKVFDDGFEAGNTTAWSVTVP